MVAANVRTVAAWADLTPLAIPPLNPMTNDGLRMTNAQQTTLFF
jgi:hypothetical protein